MYLNGTHCSGLGNPFPPDGSRHPEMLGQVLCGRKSGTRLEIPRGYPLTDPPHCELCERGSLRLGSLAE
jgi:hypothetical protein